MPEDKHGTDVEHDGQSSNLGQVFGPVSGDPSGAIANIEGDVHIVGRDIYRPPLIAANYRDDLPKVEDQRDIPDESQCVMYVDEITQGPRVRAALLEFVRAYDIDVYSGGPPEFASFWQRFWLAFKRASESDTGKRIQADIQRAIELRAVDGLQAEVDLKQAQAASALIESLANTEKAALQIGSTLILKLDGAISARSLSPQEMYILRLYPHILSHPDTCMGRIQHHLASLYPSEPRASAE